MSHEYTDEYGYPLTAAQALHRMNSRQQMVTHATRSAALTRPRNGWLDMDSAPRDGTSILVCRNNGCAWEYEVVWWVGDCTYPWSAGSNGYVEDRFDYWQPLTVPHAA